MSSADIIILICVVLFLVSVIFFSFVFPKIRKTNSHCNNCPVGNDRKMKRALSAYRKSNHKK